MIFADIIVDLWTNALDRHFEYKVPERLEDVLKVGDPVIIPFGKGNKSVKGYVTALKNKSEWPVEKLKEIISRSEDIEVEGELLGLAAWIRERYGVTMNEAIKTVMPVKTKIKSVEEHWLNFVMSDEEAKQKRSEYEEKHFHAKVRLLDAMFDAHGKPFAMSAARKYYNISKSTVDSLVKAGVISVTGEKDLRKQYQEKNNSNTEPKKILNEEQAAVVKRFCEDFDAGERKKYLLYGITGSGKTEVYMECVACLVKKGLQAIVLIPEIALTKQIVERFRERFGDRVAILNSRMSAGERYEQYERVRSHRADIAVGPRSALFMPFDRLGVIIMDEEHETSYKSGSPPKYHAREVALERARLAKASVILGSATPSVTTYKKAIDGEYVMCRLKKRASEGASLPDVHVVDMKEELAAKNRSVFSRLLKEKINERLQKKEQIMLFLNRRGYAGFVSCRSCGYVVKCTHCDISMTAHKHDGKVNLLKCHYCGEETVMPEKCPECGSPYIAAFGLGTQKVEEFIKKEFPTATVLRMDADTTRNKDGHERVLAPFREGKADILLGTQMIVKGHDFHDVTLVGALAADLSMHSGDYMGSERTFDLLMQAGGRAGRGGKHGEFVIQTYRPDEYAVEAVRANDPSIFYENELAYRKLAGYPPFSVLLAVLVMADLYSDGMNCAEALAGAIKSTWEGEATVVGPSEATLKMANDRYRFVLYVKCADETTVTEIVDFLHNTMEGTSWARRCTVHFDMDPVSGY